MVRVPLRRAVAFGDSDIASSRVRRSTICCTCGRASGRSWSRTPCSGTCSRAGSLLRRTCASSRRSSSASRVGASAQRRHARAQQRVRPGRGDIGYLDQPPPVPRHLAAWGFGLMLAGQLASLALPRGFAIAYAMCFAMSLLYSVPPVRLKAVAGADWIINMLGFGTLTPYAGWALTRIRSLRRRMGARRFRAALRRAVSPHAALSDGRGSGARRSHARDRARDTREPRALDRGDARSHSRASRAARGSRSHVSWERRGTIRARDPRVRSGSSCSSPGCCAPRECDRGAHKRGMYVALLAWAVTDAAVLVALS